MSNLLGADVEALLALAQRMKSAAEQLDRIRSEVDAALNHSQWVGPDAEHFRGQWNYRLSAMLHTAVASTQSASAILVRNADDQEATSSGTGLGATGGLAAFAGLAASVASVKDGLEKTGIALDTADVVAEGLHAAGETWPAVTRLAPDLVAPAGVAGHYIVAFGAVVDGGRLAMGIGTHDTDLTYNASADLFFDGATAASFAIGPWGPVAVAALHLGYDGLTVLDPGLTHQIVDGVGAAASGFAAGATQFGKDAVNDAETLGSGFVTGSEAIGHAIGGGFNKVVSIF